MKNSKKNKIFQAHAYFTPFQNNWLKRHGQPMRRCMDHKKLYVLNYGLRFLRLYYLNKKGTDTYEEE